MAFKYTLIRQETEPTKPQPGFFWLKQSVGQLYYCILGSWLPLVAGSSTAAPNGVYWYEVAQQSTAPTAVAGKLWIDTDTNQEFVYIGSWIPLLGG